MERTKNMPNHPMPPPYEICAAHAERLAELEQRTAVASKGSPLSVTDCFLAPRTQSAKPVAHVFPGRKPDVRRVDADLVRLAEASALMTEAVVDHIKKLESEVSELRTNRQRMADLWSRIDALEQRAQEQAADLAETREALAKAQKRLKELDVDGNGERG